MKEFIEITRDYDTSFEVSNSEGYVVVQMYSDNYGVSYRAVLDESEIERLRDHLNSVLEVN